MKLERLVPVAPLDCFPANAPEAAGGVLKAGLEAPAVRPDVKRRRLS